MGRGGGSAETRRSQQGKKCSVSGELEESDQRESISCRRGDTSERQMETEKSRTNENPYLVDCLMSMSSQYRQEQRRSLAQTLQEP